MANRERGEMRLVAGEETYTLFITTNACCELEDLSGKSFPEIVKGALSGRIRDLRWLVWASVREHHADAVASPEDAGKLIDAAGGVRGVLRQMVDFMTLNSEDAPKGSKGEPAVDPLNAQANGDVSTETLVGSA